MLCRNKNEDSTDTTYCVIDGDPWSAKQHHWKSEVKEDHQKIIIFLRKAIQHLPSGKEPGADAIPTGIYKAGGRPMAEDKSVNLSL